MYLESIASLLTFVAVTSLILLMVLVFNGFRERRLDVRLAEISGKPKSSAETGPLAQFTSQTLPRIGAALIPKKEDERTKLQSRLVHAGLYSSKAIYVFFGIKMLLMLGPICLGVLASAAQLIPLVNGLLGGAILGILGMIAPSFWLDWKKKQRQAVLRRALPDALDVLVICLEGGLSLPGALMRVSSELRTAHPLLAKELNLCQREIQMGWSSGEALRRIADRCDLEELRSLASVVSQSEHYGSSLVKSIRVHAETLRTKRMQRAEELAQKAAVKVLFPTLLFIFPGLFIVILGPAAIQIVAMFKTMNG